MSEPRRLYLDDGGETFCLVSEDRYAWAVKWKWHWVWDRHRRKKYARRTTRCRGSQYHVWLHKEICRFVHGDPPDDRHTIGDHGDGDSLNNQDWNVSWTTPAGNRRTARAPMRRAA